MTFPIVGVGASAGGLEAFTQLLQNLPTDTEMAFVLVQHLDPVRPSALTQILSKATALPVQEVTNGLRILPNNVYVIPPNASMDISRGVLMLHPRDESAGGYRSIDFFFTALAREYHERAIGVVLSGTASDGTVGLEAIKAEGGITFAQDDSAKYPSMPHSAIAAGCVDRVLSPTDIARELAEIAGHPFLTIKAPARGARTAGRDGPAAKRSVAERRQRIFKKGTPREATPNTGLKKIFLHLRNHSGVDFSLYKNSTIRRRTDRRMVLSKLTSLEAYAKFLRATPGEIDALYSDLLIGVTSFFRNPEAFDVLKKTVFPRLVPERDGPVRIWVLGCSTGQEAYSIAMAFAEYCDTVARAPKLQIFATDVNEKILSRARGGFYVKALVQDISPERLLRFFVEEEGGFRINKAIRETVIFARQNLLKDPPFSRMNLISCRNVLIYLEPNSQNQLFPKLHYALRPKGFLFLGASESIASFTDLFEQADKKHKIFCKKSGPTPAMRLDFTSNQPVERQSMAATVTQQRPEKSRPERAAEVEADRVTLGRHAPPSVLVNGEFQVLQFRGDTNQYLKPPTGRATLDVLKMATAALMLPLRAALTKAQKEQKAVRSENVRLHQAGKKGDRTQIVNIEVVPLKNVKERCYLIFFEDVGHEIGAITGKSSRKSTQTPAMAGKSGTSAAAAREIAGLRGELAETREYLQSTQEQSEAANEELQASNEEITSANEVLQSINEELETSQEELESTNEELNTVNEEMTNRNIELNLLNSDLLNFQSSAQVPIVLLTRDLVIRRFTAEAQKPFNLLATDIGRPIFQIRHNLDMRDLEEFVGGVISAVRERDREVQDTNGYWYSLRVRPYLSIDNKVDGAVLVLIDIDGLKRTAQAIAKTQAYADAIIRTSRDPVVVLDTNLQIHSANDAFCNMFRIFSAEVQGRTIVDLVTAASQGAVLLEKLSDIITSNGDFQDLELIHDLPGQGRRILLMNARVIDQLGDQPKLVVVGIRDVTDVLAYQADLRISELRYRRLFEEAHDGVLVLDPVTRKIIDANPFISQLLGYTPDELRGKELFEIGLLQDEKANIAAFEQLRKNGRIRYEDLPLQTKDGEHRAVEFVSNLYQEDGHQVIQCNIRDITLRKRADEYRDLLMAELDHRVKNTLATIQSIARHTLLNSTSLDQFRQSFEARLLAVSRTHDLLTLGEWRGASLREIIKLELLPYEAATNQRVAVGGQDIQLNSKQSVAVGMTFHELATNAAKYGALSVPGGKVEVAWDVDDKQVLQLRWIESGGPIVKKPTARGFGSQLIEHSLAHERGAVVDLDFHPDGVRFTLKLPLDLVTK